MKQIMPYSVNNETALPYPVNNETGLKRRPYCQSKILHAAFFDLAPKCAVGELAWNRKPAICALLGQYMWSTKIGSLPSVSLFSD